LYHSVLCQYDGKDNAETGIFQEKIEIFRLPGRKKRILVYLFL